MKRWLILTVLACSTRAHAQAADQRDADKAAALYDEGKHHFDIGEYSAAIAAWKQSYLVSAEPLLLFNIAQAYRLSGNCAEANRFYLNYEHAASTIANRTELDQAMAVCAGVAPATGDGDEKPVEAPPPVVTTRAAAAPSGVEPAYRSPARGRGRRTAGLVVGAIGLAAGVIAIVSSVQASNRASTVSEQPPGTEWTGALPGDQASGEAAQTRARVFGVVGGVGLLGGAVLWWLGHRAGSTRIHVAITPSLATVGLSCAF